MNATVVVTIPLETLQGGRHHTLAHHPDHTVKRQPGWRITITRAPRETPRRQ